MSTEARLDRMVAIDLSQVSQLDTAGAWLINRARHDLRAAATSLSRSNMCALNMRPCSKKRVTATSLRPRGRGSTSSSFCLRTSANSIVDALREFYRGVGFLGEFVSSMMYVAANPRRFRLTSLVAQIELVGFRSVPIIVLINILVGGIVAQQGIFQLAQVRRVQLRGQPDRHSCLARTWRAAHLDHDRRPIGLGDHRRDSAR